jgi:hypothetical protein
MPGVTLANPGPQASREPGEAQHLLQHRPGDAGFGQGRRVHARQHRDADHQRARPLLTRRRLDGRLPRRCHHLASAGRVNVHHPHTEARRGGDRRLHRVRNVVKFQVEEDAVAPFDQRAHDRGTLQREQTLADLEPANRAPQFIGELQRAAAALHVERD